VFPTNRPALKPRTQSSSSLTPAKRHDDSGYQLQSSSLTAHRPPCNVIHCQRRARWMTAEWSLPAGCCLVVAVSQTAVEHCPMESCSHQSCTDDWSAADSAAVMTMTTYPNNHAINQSKISYLHSQWTVVYENGKTLLGLLNKTAKAKQPINLIYRHCTVRHRNSVHRSSIMIKTSGSDIFNTNNTVIMLKMKQRTGQNAAHSSPSTKQPCLSSYGNES